MKGTKTQHTEMSNHHEPARDKDDYLRGNLFITRIFHPVWEGRMWTGYLQISHSMLLVLWAKNMSVTKQEWKQKLCGQAVAILRQNRQLVSLVWQSSFLERRSNSSLLHWPTTPENQGERSLNIIQNRIRRWGYGTCIFGYSPSTSIIWIAPLFSPHA